MNSANILWALAGGVLPSILWLLFWLRADKKRPEPRGRIFLTFVLGMFATIAVLPVEGFIDNVLAGSAVVLIVLWSLSEELFKYIAAYFAGLHTRANNEPIDAVIYMITAALGFAAMENTLFLLTPLGDGHIVQTIITGNMRFIGATVLHVLSSGTIGVCMALSFYRKKIVRKEAIALGLILAVVLHSIFNLLIIKNTSGNIFGVFLLVWAAIAILLLFLEQAKRLRP